MTEPDRPPSRRRFLSVLGGAAAGAAAGAAVAGPVTAAALRDGSGTAAAAPALPMGTVSPYGAHQAGIATPTPRFAEVLALDLRGAVDAAALGRLLRLWTGDVVALAAGRPAPGDTAPELATPHADLTITVGVGGRVFGLDGLDGLDGLRARRPAGLVDVPPMRHDRLEPRWSGGDLVLVVAAHDGTSVAHAARRLVADAAPFATLRWRQTGFWNGYDAMGRPVTGRNLFGQVDGSANPAPGTPLFARTVWAREPDWFRGGTTLVVRRIRLDLDGWDRLTRDQQERAVGRDLATGAPLSGGSEKDGLDLRAVRDGRRAIALDAHARLSHPTQNAGARIFRKGLNYTADAGTDRPAGTESGLLFLSFQADVGRQFVPIQQRLDAGDALNTWTTATGSATFAVLPGFRPGGWLGDTLLPR